MFATGRKPNVAGLGLEAAGVKLADEWRHRGRRVFAHLVPHIYAVGDVTNRVNLTPVAIREGHAFADTVFGDRPTTVDHANVPTAVFSEPEIGAVGLTETQARERLARVDIYKIDLPADEGDAVGPRDAHADEARRRRHDRPGARLPHRRRGAGEMVQLVGIAVRMGATKADFDATMAVHPTAAEELVTMRQPARAIAARPPNSAELRLPAE